LEWRRCLRQVFERNGALEIAVARTYDEGVAGRHLIWRVRMLTLSDEEMTVEQPMALGHLIPLKPGIEVVAILAVGQNRWMFNTICKGVVQHVGGSERPVAALRLAVPDTVERCQRRSYYRVETAAIHLPEAEVWPLLDPKSVIPAERANELAFEASQEANHHHGRVSLSQPVQARGPARGQARGLTRGPASDSPLGVDDTAEALMPEVGPKFTGALLNLGGGGIGLRVGPADAANLGRHKLFWIRFALPPELATPVCATAKLVHTHMDSSQYTYAGLAFDFSFNPGHQQFVFDQICRYITMQQAAQLESTEHRRTA
jgi:c-di-GMP-binding flagellar brake protein YcgR